MDFNTNMYFSSNNALQCGLTDKEFNINSLDYDFYRENTSLSQSCRTKREGTNNER